MRIRELIFRDFRNFRGEHRISFVDPITDLPMPITAIAGTSGTGKTTILESIDALCFSIGIGFIRPEPAWYAEVKQNGLVYAIFELSGEELGNPSVDQSELLHVAIGKKELAEDILRVSSHSLLCDLVSPNNNHHAPSITRTPPLLNEMRRRVQEMQKAKIPMRGGTIFFPHDRKLYPQRGGAIEPPKGVDTWVSHVTDSTQWQGSLEQLWVWQDYLDVKQRVQGKSANLLKPFTETVEQALGNPRTISIDEGRAYASVAWANNGHGEHKVLIDQLPSGEKQCLLVLGELARRRRPGAILLIDEPEVSLHPTLQRLLLHQLRTFAHQTDSQLILATHSLEILRGVSESSRVLLDQLEKSQHWQEVEKVL